MGYLKFPPPENAADGDTAFMQRIPGLGIASAAGLGDYDIVLAEGSLGQSADSAASRAAYAAAREMQAAVIAVEAYAGATPKFPDAYRGFGGALTGVIINKVPASQLQKVRAGAGQRLEAAGLKLLGVIPENRVLLAVTVGELAEGLRGKILNNADKSGELVENYMLGAMVVDSGAGYFGRKSRKAAIIHHDRPDMQLAALETATACLVLSGAPAEPPMYNVLDKAKTRGIPIIATAAAVGDIVQTIENTLLGARLNQPGKLGRLAETARQNLDLKALTQAGRPEKGG